MGCSQPKLSRTGLRNILAFLKVELQHFLGGTRALLRLPVARGLRNSSAPSLPPWLDRSKPAEDPLVFKGCPEGGSQIIPLSMLLPVSVPVQQSALGMYTITAETADLIDEWCDHVAEIT